MDLASDATRSRLLLAIVVTLVALGACLGAPDAGSAQTLRGKVVSVTDGDTIKVRVRARLWKVRLVGIDTPETRKPGTRVQCGGPAATARVKKMLRRGRRVRLVTDPTQDRIDRYGRLLAYVYVGRNRGLKSINHSLIRSGHARRYVYRGRAFRYLRAFTRSQLRAKRARRGIWGEPCRGNTTKAHPRPVAPNPAPATVPVGLPGTAPTPDPPPVVVTPPAPEPPPPGPCDPNYAGACLPVHPPDINCPEIVERNFLVVGEDVHELDGDGDGIACEGN